ncbi:cytosolic carboxypeptidase 2-like isoform X5 [Bolinopsis microptera]|uniref:cytosolic carboxypeptidase 2-like isoform X5 n=1 Tax=Bolinopsis microptera TaxID=2820187 RepID=UPI0030790066
MLQIFNESNEQIGIPHWYFGKTKPRSPTKLIPLKNKNKDSLALSGAHEWGYEKTRLWEHEDSTSEKEIPTRRRSSTISLKDVNSRTTQLVFGMQDGKRVPKLKEPRSLYCVPRDVVMPRWPVGIDTVCPQPDLTHNNTPPPFNEEFYKRPSGANLRLLEKTDTDKHEGTVVYHLPLMRFPFYTRSRPTAALEPCPFPLSCYDDDVLRFESRFECANLFRARRVGPYEYELELRWDYFTMKHTQWFYFRVSNTKAGPTYKFTIINLLKSGSLYNEGMKPLFYSERNAKNKNLGWLRMGHNIHYYKNNIRRKDCKGERYQYSLTWQFQFPYTSDVCYFSHCYPYSYTDLQKDLLEIANDAVKSQYVKQRILCHSLGGNMVHLLTVTTPSTHLTEAKQKRAVVVTARVHPGETNSSYMMRGFINFITGSSPDAKVLRDNFVFKIVPMLNPDGVIVGNYRSSLAARDLNRNYKNPIKDAYPSIWSVKAMIRRMLTEREVVLYCDLHGHSRKMNVFMYGCENKDPGLRLQERVFPNMMSRNTSKFKYSSCRFKVQKKKEGTGRIVMWQQMGILNSFTMEATFAGYNNVHFNSRDLEDMGYHFCDTLLDYCDPDTSKVEHVLANLTRIVMSQYAAKIGKSIEDLKDLPLEDLDISDLESSDGGSDSSVSDGPPKLPLLRKFSALTYTQKCASLQSKKKYKTRKERNQIHRQSKRRNSKQTSEPAKSKAHSVGGESSTNKEEKPAKPKLERRCSVSSAESPSTLAKQAHGIPKHAQERIEERQAKVNKKRRRFLVKLPKIERRSLQPSQRPVGVPLVPCSFVWPDPGCNPDYSILTGGIFHPPSSRDSSSPVCQRVSNSPNDSRRSLEPAKVAFRFYDPQSTKESDVVYAVLEPTAEPGADTSPPHPDKDGVHVSVVLAGVGSAYRHDLIIGEENPAADPPREDGVRNPYSVSYRTTDVNSKQLGRNTFAIRPSKSAHRSHRTKQMLPSSRSEVMAGEDQLREPREKPRASSHPIGVSSPVFGKGRPPTNLYHNLHRVKPVQSWNPTKASTATNGESSAPSPASQDKPDLSMTRLVSFRSAHNIPADAGDLRTQPVANFTSSYVDKILTKKLSPGHSVPKTQYKMVGSLLTRTEGHLRVEDNVPRGSDHVSPNHLARGNEIVKRNGDVTTQPPPSNKDQPKRHRSLAALTRGNTRKGSDLHSSSTSPPEGQKRLKQTSISWDSVKVSTRPRKTANSSKRPSGVSQFNLGVLSPSLAVAPNPDRVLVKQTKSKGVRLGFRPHKL